MNKPGATEFDASNPDWQLVGVTLEGDIRNGRATGTLLFRVVYENRLTGEHHVPPWVKVDGASWRMPGLAWSAESRLALEAFASVYFATWSTVAKALRDYAAWKPTPSTESNV